MIKVIDETPTTRGALEESMRATTFVLVLLISMAVPAVAQEWTEIAHSVRDGFKVDFPGQPTVTETTWKSEHGFMLPERILHGRKGRERYYGQRDGLTAASSRWVSSAPSRAPGLRAVPWKRPLGYRLLEA